MGRRIRGWPETPVSLRASSGQGASTAPHIACSGRGRRLRSRAPETPGLAETPHPGGVFVDEDPQAGDSSHQGRILWPAGASGHPPVILRRAIQYRTTSWRKAGKPRDRRLRPLQTGDSGHQGRILRPPGDSGHPPVILRRGIQYRTTLLAKGRKIQGPESPARPETPARNCPAASKLCHFFPF